MIHWINVMGYSPTINVLQNKNRITILNEATVIRFLWVDFGNPAIPVGPVAFRPMIAHGLALSFFLVPRLEFKQLLYHLD